MTDLVMSLSKQAKGTMLSIFGVLFLSPDTMLIRLVGDISNATVQFYRYGLYGCAISFYVLLTERSNSFNKLRQLGYLGVGAGLVFGASNLFFTAGIQSTAAANVLVIVAANPMFAAIFSWLILGEHVPLRTIATAVVCFACIAFMFATELQGSKSELLGMVYALLCTSTMGLYFVLVRCASLVKGQEQVDMIPCNIIAGFFSALVALAMGATPAEVPSSRDAVLLCVQGLLVIPVSFTLLTIGPSLISAPEVSLYMLIETVIGPVWVWLAGFEQPPMNTVYGGSVLLFALMVHSVLALRDHDKERGIANDDSFVSSGKPYHQLDYESLKAHKWKVKLIITTLHCLDELHDLIIINSI